MTLWIEFLFSLLFHRIPFRYSRPVEESRRVVLPVRSCTSWMMSFELAAIGKGAAIADLLWMSGSGVALSVGMECVSTSARSRRYLFTLPFDLR
jgi:hypothetical protein